MELKSKAETFVGFAMRTGKYKIGCNAVATMKRAYLMLVCKSASENTVKDAVKLAKRLNCKLFVTKDKLLEEFTHKENAKVMAISDKGLASAIADVAENDFIERG